MSIAVMSRLFKAQLGSPSRKMLAIRLADFADDDGCGIWPTVGRLAQETELSERTVQRLLRDFVEEGLLVVVAEGGGRPGQATRYDFDMRAIERLKDGKPSSNGCHGVTGVMVSPVTMDTERGDTDDADGCHGVTQTVIEPSDKPSLERARESEQANKESRKAVEKAFKRAFHAWPTFVDDSEPKAWKAWLTLSPEDRIKAFEETSRYIEVVKATGRGKICSYQIYLIEKRWEKLPAKAEVSENAPAQAAPFGKLWGARVYSLLLGGPTHEPALTQIEMGLVETGRFTAEHLLRENRAKRGFPAVNELFERAEGRRGVLVPPSMVALKDFLAPVKVGGDVWQTWEQFHRDCGWPWFPDPGRLEYVHLPMGGPDGLEDFKAAVRGLGENDGN